jgi:hypothetical protein
MEGMEHATELFVTLWGYLQPVMTVVGGVVLGGLLVAAAWRSLRAWATAPIVHVCRTSPSGGGPGPRPSVPPTGVPLTRPVPDDDLGRLLEARARLAEENQQLVGDLAHERRRTARLETRLAVAEGQG